jgi:hypothetical protein
MWQRVYRTYIAERVVNDWRATQLAHRVDVRGRQHPICPEPEVAAQAESEIEHRSSYQHFVDAHADDMKAFAAKVHAGLCLVSIVAHRDDDLLDTLPALATNTAAAQDVRCLLSTASPLTRTSGPQRGQHHDSLLPPLP